MRMGYAVGMARVGLLVVGGRGPTALQVRPWLSGVTDVVAADSGFDLAKGWQLEPDLVVGDLDSTAYADQLRGGRVPVQEFSTDKDETDSEIGVRTLFERGCTEVRIAGGGGGRMDHLLGLVALFERSPAPSVWITHQEHVQVIHGPGAAEFAGYRGQTVSFFPLSDGAAGLGSSGLKWSLDGLEWQPGHAGISNVVTDERMRVEIARGSLLMVRLMPAAGQS